MLAITIQEVWEKLSEGTIQNVFSLIPTVFHLVVKRNSNNIAVVDCCGHHNVVVAVDQE